MDLSIFLTAEAWITLVTLLFLEIVLGVDNIVFISITTNRLPREKQHIGRKLGLAGALIMRVIFLTIASFLASMKTPFAVFDLGFYVLSISVHDLIMFFGGAYLIYKGITELLDTLRLTELREIKDSDDDESYHKLTLPKAIGTIMVMDLVFSIDSVITAVGLADHLIIMILAVIIAILIMMIFIDAVANFINEHVEMKILALCFITVIGVLLFTEGLHLETGIMLLDMQVEKLMVYFGMVFSVVIALIQMKYNKNYHEWHIQQEAEEEKEHAFDHVASFDYDAKLDADDASLPEEPNTPRAADLSVDGGIHEESAIIERNTEEAQDLYEQDKARARAEMNKIR